MNDNNDLNLINVKDKDFDKIKNDDATNVNKVAKRILNECNIHKTVEINFLEIMIL